ncbi:MAG: SDR family oxidoreductase [bacterium]
MNFKDKVVIITGGTGGLGFAVTQAFLNAGAKVVVTYTYEEKLNHLKLNVKNAPGELLALKTDVLDESRVKSMVENVVNKFGRIDVLVNLVGGFLGGVSIVVTTVEQWDKMINLNLKSAFLCCRHVLPIMMKQKYGRMINIGSKGGLQGTKGISAYAAFKSGVINFTQSLAAEGKPYNVTANLVVPGTIDTPDNRRAMPQSNFSDWVTPDSLAEVILFLSSDAAKDVSAAMIPVYGKS